jgi:hypothetical protein
MIQAVIAHSLLATSGRYLPARQAAEQAAAFTRAFEALQVGPGPAQTHDDATVIG